jgi:hypothetical protein
MRDFRAILVEFEPMENVTATATETLAPLAGHLRAAVADLISEADRVNDAMIAAGVGYVAWGEDLEAALRDALEDIDVFLDLDCDPDVYLYWWERVHLLGHLEEIREGLDPADWGRFLGVHERFEARFPRLARDIALMAARRARTLDCDEVLLERLERLERRAFRALDLMAEGAA